MKGINNKPRRTGTLLRLATMVLLATHLALAAIPEAATNYPASAISPVGKTPLDIAPKDDFAACPCDLTAGACDVNCCCDSDCPAQVVARWTRNPSVNCQEHYKAYRTIPFAACSAETNRRQLTDIQNGLQYFGKLGNLLMCAAKTGKIQDTQKFVEGLRGAPSGS